MKKRGRKICAILLSMLLIVCLCACSEKKESGEEFNGYSIEIGECIYNSITKTGSVELQITSKGWGLEKLVYTSEDVLHNGFDIIVDDEYSLRVSDGERSLECQAYEVDYQDKTQTVKIYYVDLENAINSEHIDIQIIEPQSNNVVKSLQGELKIENKAMRYICHDAPLDIYMSSTGIFLDSGTNWALDSEQRTAVALNLKSKDKKYVMAIDSAAEIKVTDNKELIKAKKYVKGDRIRAYATDIEDWDKIEMITFDDYIYANENMPEQVSNAGKIETFYTEDLSTVKAFENQDIEDCYITNKCISNNRFHIDKNNVLWGCGYNYYGQLGINHPEDTNSFDTIYEKDQKIAENVIHVDCSSNGYFMVYLTKDNELYGVGANLQGVLGEDVKEEDYLNPWRNVVYTPKLLMRDIVYVRAGRECVIALKKNGDVYWWGEFADEKSREIFGTEPRLVMQKAVYAVTGDNHAAVITSEGELYTWGINMLGQCGAEIEDQYIVEPVQVMDHVRMAWCDDIEFDSVRKEWNTEQVWYDIIISEYHNTFVATKDGDYYAAGKDLGTKFLPIKIQKMEK